jgi:hypothetical protein
MYSPVERRGVVAELEAPRSAASGSVMTDDINISPWAGSRKRTSGKEYTQAFRWKKYNFETGRFPGQEEPILERRSA